MITKYFCQTDYGIKNADHITVDTTNAGGKVIIGTSDMDGSIDVYLTHPQVARLGDQLAKWLGVQGTPLSSKLWEDVE